MEVRTASTPSGAATASKTLADLVLLSTKARAQDVALRYKDGDQWRDVSYEELGGIVKEVTLGLAAIGLGTRTRSRSSRTRGLSGRTRTSASSAWARPPSRCIRRTPPRSASTSSITRSPRP